MNNHLISIIIPSYNGELFIKDAIESCLGQSYSNIEIIVYDDGSTDSTEQAVGSIKDSRLRYFYSQNEGLTRTLNKALYEAKGEYICWLNQDDIFLPQKVEMQYKTFLKDPSLGAVFSYKTDIDEEGNPIERSNPSRFCLQKREEVLLFLFQGCFLSAPTVMIKKAVFPDVGYFNEGMAISFDYDMWFRILKKYSINVLSDPLVCFRHHSKNLSNENTGPPTAIIESCSVILNAMSIFTVEDIFPWLKRDFPDIQEKNNAYCQAYITWASYIFDNTWWRQYLLMPVFSLILKAIAYNPMRAEAYKLAEKICAEAGMTRQRAYYNKIYADRLDLFSTLLDRLEYSIKKDLKKLTRKTCAELFSISPEHRDIYFRLHKVFKEMGNEKEADYFLQLIKKDTQDENHK